MLAGLMNRSNADRIDSLKFLMWTKIMQICYDKICPLILMGQFLQFCPLVRKDTKRKFHVMKTSISIGS